MMNFTGQFCSRLQFEGLVMMENRPSVTRFRSGIISEDQPFLQTTRSRVYSLRLQSSSRFHYGSVPMGSEISKMGDGLTFDTKGENIIWSSGSQLYPRGGLTLFSPLANSFILNHRKWLVAPSELLKRGPS